MKALMSFARQCSVTVAACLACCELRGAVTYFASPNGDGDGGRRQRPCRVMEAIPRLRPGDTLFLLDGTYVGDHSMILVSEPVRGTPDAPITIKALNEGKVRIDGENERCPVRLLKTEYVRIEGIDACRAQKTVVGITETEHCVIRRICGWDAADDNTNIFGVHYSQHTLVEDCAGWGVARKTFSCSYNGNHTTFRRCWGRWEGCTNVGPKMVITVSYNSHHTLVENCIGTWDARKMPAEYIVQGGGKPYTNWGNGSKQPVTKTDYAVDQPYGIFSFDTREGPGVRLLGCIAYRTPEQRLTGYVANYFIARTPDAPAVMENCLSFSAAGAQPRVPGFRLNNVRATGLTAIGASGNQLGSGPVADLLVTKAAAGLVKEKGNILTPATGARLECRYVDGMLTDEPLWPWPMNTRIKALTGVDVTRTVFELGGGTLPESLAP